MRAGIVAKAIDSRDHLKRLVPVRYQPGVVERKVDRLWDNEQYRQAQETQMRYLLEYTDRAPEIPELARKFAESALLRSYRRWHPAQLLRQPVRGIEWLTTRRDSDRSIVLNFMHHSWYEGLFGSLAHAGAPITVLGTPLLLGPETPAGLKQHIRVVQHGDNPYIPATGGTEAIQARIRPGMTMAIASDVPGHTEVTFLGRRVLASFGAALIATNTNSQVVVVTARRTDGGSYLQLHEPLEPKDFAKPIDLLQEILDQHGEAVLAWPEVLDMPRARWGIIQE